MYRWSVMKNAWKINHKKRAEDISNLPQQSPGLSRIIIQQIESRINLIEETISLHSSSTSDNNIQQDKQLEDIVHKDSVIFGSFPSQKENISICIVLLCI